MSDKYGAHLPLIPRSRRSEVDPTVRALADVGRVGDVLLEVEVHAGVGAVEVVHLAGVGDGLACVAERSAEVHLHHGGVVTDVPSAVVGAAASAVADGAVRRNLDPEGKDSGPVRAAARDVHRVDVVPRQAASALRGRALPGDGGERDRAGGGCSDDHGRRSCCGDDDRHDTPLQIHEVLRTCRVSNSVEDDFANLTYFGS